MIYEPPLAMLLNAVSALGTQNASYDFNYDGWVTVKDILFILANIF